MPQEQRRIGKIWVKGIDYKTDKVCAAQLYIDVGQINVFVGRNNSGKSRFVRGLFSADFRRDVLIDCAAGRDLIDLSGLILSTLSKFPTNAFFNESQQVVMEQLHYNVVSAVEDMYETLRSVNFSKIQNMQSYGDYSANKFFNTVKPIFSKFNYNYQGFNVNRFYVPTLRGMRLLAVGAEDPYLKKTADDYFSGKADGVVTGHDLYTELSKLLLGTPENRAAIRNYEQKLSEYFFEGKQIAIIPRFQTNVVYIKVGDDEELPVHQLGDGLQQIIILTYKAFLHSEPALFMVEEPEVHLHAGMLRKLMHFWVTETPQHQYFVTTHSNHLLAIEELQQHIHVFKVKKQGGEFNVNRIDKDRSILADLGVQASSVYLANCTIWVEGITDRRYLQTYMRRYLKDLKAGEADGDKPSVYHRFVENYHYSFVEYQGGGLAHWDFGTDDEEKIQADVVCAEGFLLVDGDIESKGDRLMRLRESLGERLYITLGKEIENLLPDTIVKQVVINLFARKHESSKGGVLAETVETIQLPYDRYYQSMDGLGHHIDRAIGLKGKGARRIGAYVFSEQSGTVKDKVKFCEEACKLMDDVATDWELPEPVKALCEKIFAHIALHND